MWKSFYILVICITMTSSICPPKEFLAPCTCQADEITCGGNEELDLWKIFGGLYDNSSQTQKHFKSFRLKNTNIRELKANTFRDFVFDSIDINSCENLTTIDKNSFTETNLVTDRIVIYENPKLSSPDNSIFEVLSKFKNASYIDLGFNNITEIPSNAFLPVIGHQNRLKELHLKGKDFKKIGDHPFYYLNWLKTLQIYNTSINYLPENTLTFEKPLNTTLDLLIYENKFTQTFNISTNALLSIKRPTRIHLDDIHQTDDHLTYIDEKVFLSFMLINAQNSIILANKLDCNDCRNLWINRDKGIQGRFEDIICSNNKTVNDPDNFKKCSNLFKLL